MSAISEAWGRGLDAADRLQRRWRPVACTVAVLRRYSDDRGGQQAALITFYGLLSVFPLLLLLITFASRILGAQSEAARRLVHSALEQFPVIGTRLADNIHALATGSWLALVGSALFLLWGALGITNALQSASARIWRVPRVEEPDFWHRIGRGLRLLGVIAASVVLVSIFTGVSTSGWLHQYSSLLALGALVLEAAINLGAYLVALKILAPKGVQARELVPGMIVGGLGWTLLQQVGGYLLSHQLHRTSEIYGFFAIVLGLIFWLNLGAQLFLVSTELNVVLARREWPRSIRGRAPQDEA